MGTISGHWYDNAVGHYNSSARESKRLAKPAAINLLVNRHLSFHVKFVKTRDDVIEGSNARELLAQRVAGNSGGLLFPNRNGRPRKWQYVVKFGLKPLLRKLALPTKDVGLHAFRHGLGTALANSKVSPKTVQQILRHTDIKTTLRYYVHSDTDAQRNALSQIAIATNLYR